MQKIYLDIVERAYLTWMLQNREIDVIPKITYDKIYDYLVQEMRIVDKNKIFKYHKNIVNLSELNRQTEYSVIVSYLRLF